MKKIKASILMLLCLVCVLSLSACGNKTVEKYVDSHPEFVTNITDQFKDSGFEADVKIKENTIKTTIDLSSKFENIDVTDELKDTVVKSFDESMDYMSNEMAAFIKEIQERSGAKNAKMKVSIVVNGETWAKYEFDENSESEYE